MPGNRSGRGSPLVSRHVVGFSARGPRRSGFTVLELLVVAMAMSLLAALLAPAVQSSREAARKMRCGSNLRQMALAAQEFHAAQTHLPEWRTYNVDLLPFLDQAAAQDLILGWRHGSLTDEDFFRQIPLVFSPYLCPSDPWDSISSLGASPCHYLPNGGSTFPRCDGSGLQSAVRGDNDFTRFRDIRDGLSQTALFAERLANYQNNNGISPDVWRRDPIRFTFWIDRGFFDPGMEAQFAAYCADRSHIRFDLDAAAWVGGGTFWYNGYVTPESRSYDHILPPNRISCMRGPPFPNATVRDCAAPTTSLHRGGVNVALCDGSVRFVGESINGDVWRAVGTISGRDLAGGF